MEGPWTFAEATQKCRDATALQKAVESGLRKTYHDYAVAEEAYRKALAEEIVKAHNDGVAWTAAADLARGDPHVAKLRRERDVAEGMKEAMVQEAWRRAADRRDAQRFTDWSMRREISEYHGQETPEGAIAP